MNGITLHRGKERPIKERHHWIFSRAIASAPKFENGDILPVYSYNNELLGHAMLNNDTAIAGRMINFDSQDPITSLKVLIKKAIQFREILFKDSNTNAYRLVNGEADGLSGLVIDKYNKVFVIQIVSSGMEKLKGNIIDILKELQDVDCTYEKSTIKARQKDGLAESQGILFGDLPTMVEIQENGVKFLVDIKNSQKTGLFLDQREMRKLVGEYAKGKSLLNCFSYTGGFSLYASLNGATNVVSVDIASDAIELSKENYKLNGLPVKEENFLAMDAFDYLHSNPLDFDFIILDPPAFAKKKEDIHNATRGYLDINRTTLQKMPSNSFLLTCSCSYHLSLEMFEDLVKRAGLDAGRNIRIISKHRLSADHPINIYHSELDYLKSLLLFVS